MNDYMRAIQSVPLEPWSDGACLGYVIRAMENADFESDDIALVTTEMKELLDFVSLDEASAYHRGSPY